MNAAPVIENIANTSSFGTPALFSGGEELIVAAPPQFLGLIRRSMKVDVERTVRARISKNLVRTEERDVAERIRDEVLQTGWG